MSEVISNVGSSYEKFTAFKSRESKSLNAYKTVGFISSGTYGNVFKATKGNKTYAIKKFKPDKEGDAALSSGISQSAIREIGLCRELHHENVVLLEEVVVDCKDRSIAMIFEYAEHDLLVPFLANSAIVALSQSAGEETFSRVHCEVILIPATPWSCVSTC